MIKPYRSLVFALVAIQPLLRPIIPYLGGGIELRWVLEYLASQAHEHPALVAEMLDGILAQTTDGIGLIGRQDEIWELLSAAMSSDSTHATSTAEKCINLLGESGAYRYRDLLDTS